MSRRTTLTTDDIARAAAGLQAAGKNVTVAAVVALTGGSNTTVCRLLREWRGDVLAQPARAVPPVAGQDGGNLPAPVAAALAHLGQAVAAAIDEARADMDALADHADRLHDTVMDCGNTVSRQEHEDVVRQRNDAMTALMHAAHYILDPADRAEWAELGGDVVKTAIRLHDLAEREVQSDPPPSVTKVKADCNDNTVTGNTVTSDTAAKAPAVTDDEIKAAIADLTAQTGRVPSLAAIRKALGGRPVGEHRLRRAQAEARERLATKRYGELWADHATALQRGETVEVRGEMTRDIPAVLDGGWSTSEQAALCLIFDRADLAHYSTKPGDLWRRLDGGQRRIVRELNPRGAAKAEKAAGKSLVADHG